MTIEAQQSILFFMGPFDPHPESKLSNGEIFEALVKGLKDSASKNDTNNIWAVLLELLMNHGLYDPKGHESSSYINICWTPDDPTVISIYTGGVITAEQHRELKARILFTQDKSTAELLDWVRKLHSPDKETKPSEIGPSSQSRGSSLGLIKTAWLCRGRLSTMLGEKIDETKLGKKIDETNLFEFSIKIPYILRDAISHLPVRPFMDANALEKSRITLEPREP